MEAKEGDFFAEGLFAAFAVERCLPDEDGGGAAPVPLLWDAAEPYADINTLPSTKTSPYLKEIA